MQKTRVGSRAAAWWMALGACCGTAWADNAPEGAKTDAAAQAAPNPAAAAPATASGGKTQAAPDAREAEPLPKIRWSEKKAQDTRDARVEVGGIRMSMPGAGTTASGPGTPPVPSRVDDPTLIVVPNNTIGPGPYGGESLQQHNERVRQEIRLSEAMADLAEQRVEQEARTESRWGTTVIRAPHGGSYFGRRYGLFGPVTTTTTTFDDLGSSAQREFAEAARPRLGAIEEGRAEAVRRFGADATAPVVRTQRERDEAFLKGNREGKK